MDNIILISKDVLRKDYLPQYGNTYYKTPNIDELARKGTVFNRHYTAAPSTAMAFTSMFTGKYPYQTGRKDYTEIEKFDIDGGTTLFDELNTMGYECHLVWSSNYTYMAERFSRCYGKNTIHHEQLELNQYVGPHLKSFEQAVRNDVVAEENYRELIREIDTIDSSRPVFLWVHLPHVFKGRIGYGDDIDLLDRFVGDIRQRFGDCIYLTADHGSNNGKDGKTGYGFDLYESAISIPLITPRIGNYSEYNELTSNINLMNIILEKSIPKNDYVISDTAYYEQPHRKIAIIKGNYKLIYDKRKKQFQMFDVAYDVNENIDLASEKMYDIDRKRYVYTNQVLFYPYREEAERTLAELKGVFYSIWNKGSSWLNLKNSIILQMKNVYDKLLARKKYRSMKK